MLRIVFIGAVQFSATILDTMIGLNAHIKGVVTANQSKLNSDFCDLRPICEKHGIPVLQTRDINGTESVEWIRNKQPDVIFCMGWSRLIKQEVLSISRLGVVGYHPASLPKNRGRHPLIWALALGLDCTASTFFFMDEGADTGDIVSQVPVVIDPADDATSLYKKIEQIACGQIHPLLSGLEQGTPKRIPQSPADGNSWRKRGQRDGKIDWRMSAKSIHNLVRALTRPYVGAEFAAGQVICKVWRSRLVELQGMENIEFGKVLSIGENGQPTIKCGDMAVELLEFEPKVEFTMGSYL